MLLSIVTTLSTARCCESARQIRNTRGSLRAHRRPPLQAVTLVTSRPLELARLSALKADTRGVTAMEYGLIAAFIAVAIIGGLTLLGGNLDAMLNGIAAKFVAP